MSLQTDTLAQINALQTQANAGVPSAQASLDTLNAFYQKMLDNGGVLSPADTQALEGLLDTNEKTVLAAEASGTQTIIAIALISIIVIGIAAALIFKHVKKTS